MITRRKSSEGKKIRKGKGLKLTRKYFDQLCIQREARHTCRRALLQESYKENEKPEEKLPPMYRVVLLNDDYTPMDFVIEILKVFFGMNHDRATQVMLHVHTKGKGVCGVFTYEIAETKVAQVNEYSRQNEHPLKCTLEKA